MGRYLPLHASAGLMGGYTNRSQEAGSVNAACVDGVVVPRAGLGLRSAVRTSESVLWSNWADCLPTMQDRHPENCHKNGDEIGRKKDGLSKSEQCAGLAFSTTWCNYFGRDPTLVASRFSVFDRLWPRRTLPATSFGRGIQGAKNKTQNEKKGPPKQEEKHENKLWTSLKKLTFTEDVTQEMASNDSAPKKNRK